MNHKIPTIIQMIANAAQKYPDSIALQMLESNVWHHLSYCGLINNITLAQEKLLQMGLQQGDRVVILSENRIEAIVAYLAVIAAEGVAVMLGPNLPPDELQKLITTAQARAIIVSTQSLSIITAMPDAQVFPVYLLQEHFLHVTGFKTTIEMPRSTDTSPEVATILFTSGTTGHCIGVMLTHDNILQMVKTSSDLVANVPKDSLLCLLPIYHVFGLIVAVLTELSIGAAVTFIVAPTPETISLAMQKIRPTLMPVVPQLLALFYNKIHTEIEKKSAFTQQIIMQLAKLFYLIRRKTGINLTALLFYKIRQAFGGRLSRLICGGSALDKQLLQKMQEYGFTILNGYGLTETTGVVCCSRLNEVCNGSVGRPVPNVSIRIDHANEKGIGEVCIQGPTIMHGYFREPAATQEIMRDGWLHTGDTGMLDASGILTIKGRIKEIIVTANGENVMPQEIEDHYQGIKEISELFVVGITIPGQINEHIHAAVVIDEKYKQQFLEQGRTLEKLHKKIEHTIHDCAASLPISWDIEKIHFVTTLPKTALNKIKRHVLKEQLLKTVRLEKRPAYIKPKTALEKNLAAIWEEILGIHPIGMQDDFFALGGDSLLASQLFSQLRQSSSQPIDIKLLVQNPVLMDFAAEIAEANISVTQRATVVSATPAQNIQLNTSNATDDTLTSFDKFSEFIDLEKMMATLGTQAVNNLFFNVTSGVSRDTITISGKEYINFSGYNYLGMSGDPQVMKDACAAIQEFGTSVSASRLVAGQKNLHIELEQAIADLIGTEDCVVLTAGHATNILAITTFFSAGDLILHDELSHNSLIQGATFSGAQRLAFPHNDYQALELLLGERRAHFRRVLIITEGVFSMDGDIPDLPALVAIKKRHQAMLMVDEAHSMGVLGKTGRGIREYFDLAATDVDIWMGTLSKSLGSCGGYLAGCRAMVKYLKYRGAGFVFSAGMTPANAAAALSAVKILKAQPQRVAQLHAISAFFLSLLKQKAINTGLSKDSPIIPIIVGNSKNALLLSIKLRECGIYAMPILYPAVADNAARVRFFINCLHSEQQIKTTVDSIVNCMSEL